MPNSSSNRASRNDSTESHSENEMSNVDLDVSTESDSDDDVSEPSTIYDPCVLDLDPKYKCVPNRIEEPVPVMRGSIRFPGQDLVLMEGPASPPRRSGLFGSTESPESGELPVFCCGVFPLAVIIIVVNIVSILVGIASLTFGAYEVHRGQPFAAFVNSTSMILTSGPKIAAFYCIGFGIAMVGIGAMGIVTAKDASDGRIHGSRKVFYGMFQGFAVLTMLIFILMAGVSVSALKMWSTDDILTLNTWQANMHTHPDQYCKSELQLHCSGFRVGQCQVNDTSRQNCPGHFCIDFCNVDVGNETSSVNQATICMSCRQASALGYNFASCKRFEVSSAVKSGCGATLTSELQNSYVVLLILSILASGWMLVVMGLAAHRTCCAPPSSRHGIA